MEAFAEMRSESKNERRKDLPLGMEKMEQVLPWDVCRATNKSYHFLKMPPWDAADEFQNQLYGGKKNNLLNAKIPPPPQKAPEPQTCMSFQKKECCTFVHMLFQVTPGGDTSQGGSLVLAGTAH